MCPGSIRPINSIDLPASPRMQKGPLPLVVAVTGHRNLREQDLPRLEARVRDFFAKLAHDYPSSPVFLLCSLAEGADRLATRVGLARGARLIVPLPRPLEEYRTDFKTAKSQADFEDLLGKAVRVFVSSGVSGVAAATPEEEKSRDWGYARVGHFLVHHSHILLALWDGDTREKLGGTSQVVRLKQQGLPFLRPPSQALLDTPESGTVVQIVTPRDSNPDPPHAFRMVHLYPHTAALNRKERAHAGKIFLSLLQRADAFNRDAVNLHQEREDDFQQSLSFIRPGRALGELDPAFQRLLEQFATADALAIFFRQNRHVALKWLCLLVVPASVALAAYHATGQQAARTGPILCLAIFLLSVLAAMAVHTWAKLRQYETKHLDYRALAEGLRVLFFWRLAGVQDDIGAQYLRKHLSEIDWIRLALRTCDLASGFSADSVKVEETVLKHWMIDQREFFRTAGPENRGRAELHDRWATGLIVASLTLASGMYFVQITAYVLHLSLPSWLSTLLHVLNWAVVIFLAIAGGVAVFSEKLAYAQLSKQYDLMLHIFTTAADRYEKSLQLPDLDQARWIMWRLGHEALRENADWVLLHRERPMEIRLG
jgi:hypothetical protein